MTRIYALTFLLCSVCFALPATAQGDGAKFTTFAGFELGKVTLGQVAEHIGPARLLESGEAGEYEAKICYRTNVGLVYFLSGEMGGREHDLLGFAVSRNDTAKPCSKFPANRAPKKLTLAGLRLGLTKAEFSRVVATSVQWDGNVGRVFFESKRTMSTAEINNLPQEVKLATLAGKMQNYCDVLVSVIGIFSGDKLIEFQVWKVETL